MHISEKSTYDNLLKMIDEVEDYAIILLDADGHIQIWNAGAKRIKKYTEDEIIGKHFSVFYTDSDKKNNKPEWLLETAKKEGKASEEGWRVRKDGSLFWGNVVVNAIHDETNNVVGFGKLIRDLTESKKAQLTRELELKNRALEKQSYIISTLVTDHASSMLAYWDKDQICRFANDAYKDWFGKAQEEMIDKITMKELLGPLYETTLPYILGVLEGKRQTFEREINIPSGEIRFSFADYSPHIELGEVKGFFVNITDTTSLKLLEKELLRTKQLEAKNKELEQFTFIASHDLQEPLRTVSNYIEILKEDYGDKLDEQGNKFLNTIDNASKRMKALVSALLDYSRLGMAKEISPVNCNEVLQHVLIDLENLIRTTKTKITCAAQLPIIYGVETELRQLFQNLISNAIKFSKKDCLPKINIECKKKETQWQFSITDNGIGIEPENLGRIFNIFQRTEITKNYEGYGIGLANCKKIVEVHGGKIWVESQVDYGSTFYFIL
jgi:PAS domain S-box-containing protein